MNQLVEEIHNQIKDYRIDEGFGISEQRIVNWINQFSMEDREFILQEMKYAFTKVYFSKERAMSFLYGIINKLSKDFGYTEYKSFLDNANFLDLQPEGKSQKVLLELLKEVLKKDFSYEFSDLGSQSQKHNIYIDDVLCTGNTFYRNIKDWVCEEGKQRLEKLKSKEINLTVMYMLIAEKYHKKKVGQFYHNVDNDFRNLITTCSIYWFENERLKPVEIEQPELVTEYEAKVTKNANDYAAGRYSYEPDFYRKEQALEGFYSSVDNRKRLENIFLKKGIDILNNSQVTMQNIRPLGYSLPAYKDFGIGILFFTWRNIPNNSPIVFWYAGGGFMSLFINKR